MADDSNACTSMSSELLFDDEGKDEQINENADLVSILAK